jgi:hypothetical protein
VLSMRSLADYNFAPFRGAAVLAGATAGSTHRCARPMSARLAPHSVQKMANAACPFQSATRCGQEHGGLGRARAYCGSHRRTPRSIAEHARQIGKIGRKTSADVTRRMRLRIGINQCDVGACGCTAWCPPLRETTSRVPSAPDESLMHSPFPSNRQLSRHHD